MRGISPNFSIVDYEEADNYKELECFLMKYIKELRHPQSMIVIEDFFGGVGKDAQDPLRVIGVVEYICQREGFHYCHQSPTILQNLKSDPRLRDLKSPHIRSAFKHALWYSRNR
jgi:hypothetical protein